MADRIVLARRLPTEIQSQSRFEPVSAQVHEIVSGIIRDVKTRGEAGLLEHAIRLGDIKVNEPYIMNRDELKEAYDTLPEDQQQLLHRISNRIFTFAG